MQIKLNEQSYLTNFGSRKARWYLVTPGANSLQATAVINDDDAETTVDLLVPFANEETIVVR